LRIAGSLIYSEVQWLHPSEARSWLEPAIKKAREMLADGSPVVRMEDFIRALIGLGATYGWYGHPDEAAPLLEEGIELARRHGQERHLVYATGIKYGGTVRVRSDEEMRELEEAIAIGRKLGLTLELMFPLGSYGMAYMASGRMDEAETYVEEALELAQQLDNPYVNAVVQSGMGFMARLRGDLPAAREHALAALENYEALNMQRSAVTAISELAHIARRAGNLEEAETHYQRSILGWQELGHISAVAHQVECFAYIALERGQYERAARLLGAAGYAREKSNMLSDIPHEIAEKAGAMQRLLQAMGEEERDKALAAGRQITLDEAVTMAISDER
jgi:tetratricopeptide (TPR) repeat protein